MRRIASTTVAHALVRAVSRLVSTPFTDDRSGFGKFRQECRHGTHKCVRHADEEQ